MVFQIEFFYHDSLYRASVIKIKSTYKDPMQYFVYNLFPGIKDVPVTLSFFQVPESREFRLSAEADKELQRIILKQIEKFCETQGLLLKIS